MSRMLLPLTVGTGLLSLVGPLSAQAPDGWTYRLDAPQALRDTPDLAAGEWRYTRMPPGWHVTTTEQGVVLAPDRQTLQGRWAIEVELFLFPDPSDAGLGITLDLADGEGDQIRFLMRRDGQAALIGRRGGRDTTAVAWTADTAATAHAGGVDRYVLRLTAESGALAFAINGHEMFAFPLDAANRTVRPGLRIGPGLNVHVSRYDLVTPLAPPRSRRSGT